MSPAQSYIQFFCLRMGALSLPCKRSQVVSLHLVSLPSWSHSCVNKIPGEKNNWLEKCIRLIISTYPACHAWYRRLGSTAITEIHCTKLKCTLFKRSYAIHMYVRVANVTCVGFTLWKISLSAFYRHSQLLGLLGVISSLWSGENLRPHQELKQEINIVLLEICGQHTSISFHLVHTKLGDGSLFFTYRHLSLFISNKRDRFQKFLEAAVTFKINRDITKVNNRVEFTAGQFWNSMWNEKI